MSGKKGISLAEVMVVSSLLIMLLATFLILFRGINNESRLAEAYSDITTNTARAADQIKTNHLSLEFIFDKNQISNLIPRLQGLNMYNGTSFPEIISNIQDFRNLSFPNQKVGNAIASLSFEGVTILNSQSLSIPLPKYKIKIIHLQSTNQPLRSFSNITILNLVISESRYIYSNEVIKNIQINPEIASRIQNYIFIDKNEVNNMNNFFKTYNNGWQDYTGPIPIHLSKPLLKNESYQGIVYSMAYNRNFFGNMNIPVRIPAWASQNNNFPGGLEIIIIGPKTSRKVYTRLVTIADMSKGNVKFHTITVTSNVSEKF